MSDKKKPKLILLSSSTNGNSSDDAMNKEETDLLEEEEDDELFCDFCGCNNSCVCKPCLVTGEKGCKHEKCCYQKDDEKDDIEIITEDSEKKRKIPEKTIEELEKDTEQEIKKRKKDKRFTFPDLSILKNPVEFALWKQFSLELEELIDQAEAQWHSDFLSFQLIEEDDNKNETWFLYSSYAKIEAKEFESLLEDLNQILIRDKSSFIIGKVGLTDHEVDEAVSQSITIRERSQHEYGKMHKVSQLKRFLQCEKCISDIPNWFLGEYSFQCLHKDPLQSLKEDSFPNDNPPTVILNPYFKNSTTSPLKSELVSKEDVETVINPFTGYPMSNCFYLKQK